MVEPLHPQWWDGVAGGNLDSPGKRVSMRDCLHWVGLWKIILSEVTDVEIPSSHWVAPFPGQGGPKLFKSKEIQRSQQASLNVFVLSLSALDSGCEVNSCLMLLP